MDIDENVSEIEEIQETYSEQSFAQINESGQIELPNVSKDISDEIEEIKEEEQKPIGEDSEDWEMGHPSPYLSGITDKSLPSAEFDDLGKVAEAKILKAKLQVIKKVRETFGLPSIEDVPEPNELEKQILKSMEKLMTLLQDCNESINNVRIATIKKESKRLRKERELRSRLIADLQTEHKIVSKKYKKITNTWSDIKKYNDPLDIHHATNEQRDRCVSLLERKDAVINKLKDIIKSSDKLFLEELIQQEEDVNVMVDRVNEQLSIIADAYRKELEIIEIVTNDEKKECLKTNKERWMKLLNEKTNIEDEVIQNRIDVITEHEKKLDELILSSQESMRKKKIQYLNYIRNLTLKVEEMRGICDLNTQKLKYNYNLLMEREEENRICQTNLQKKISDLQQKLINARTKACKENEDLAFQIEKVKDDLQFYTDDIIALGKKADIIANAKSKKYFQLFDYNKKVADELVQKILDIEKLFYEQQLGMPWEVPQIIRFTKEEMPSYIRAKQILAELNNKDEYTIKKIEEFRKAAKEKIPTEEAQRRDRILQAVLKTLADKTGFLVEDKLEQFMEGLTQDEKTLIKLDQVMQHLGVKSKEDMIFLSRYLLPYTFCEKCDFSLSHRKKPELQHSAKNEDDLSDMASLGDEQYTLKDMARVSAARLQTSCDVIYKEFCEEDQEDKLCSSAMLMTDSGLTPEPMKIRHPTILPKEPIKHHSFHHKLSLEPSELEENAQVFGLDKALTRKFPTEYENEEDICKGLHVEEGQPIVIKAGDKDLLSCKQMHHTPTIPSMYVVRAIRDFMIDYHNVNKEIRQTCVEGIVSKDRLTLLRLIDEEEVKEFWKNYMKIFTKSQEEQWATFQMAMKNYIEDLRRRQKLNEDVKRIKRTNQELRRLLQRYLEPRRNITVFEQIVEKIDQAMNSSTDSNLCISDKTPCLK